MEAQPLVVLYNQSWLFPPMTATDGGSPCMLTDDRALLPRADAVAFHLPTLWPSDLPTKQPGQLWIGCWMESEVWYPWLADPQFLGRFDITVSHRRDADVWSPYFAPWVLQGDAGIATPKTAGVVYIQSNGLDGCGRRNYVRRLMRRVKIDSYGHSLKNKPLPEEDRGRDTKMHLLVQYKFTLAFENSIAIDYVTEKFYEPLAAGSVPVYRGAPNILDLAPDPDCFINADRFDSPEDLAAYLNHLLENEDEYQAYLAWRTRAPSPAFSEALKVLQTDRLERLAVAIRVKAATWAG